jgi:hypothetical protein
MEAMQDATPASDGRTRATDCSLEDRFLCLVQRVEHLLTGMPVRIYVGDESRR